MSDLETLIRETFTDDRRRVVPPDDAMSWVGRAVRRQRRRHAVVGVAVTTMVALAAAAVVVPFVTNVPAIYVAGHPDAASGLLPWKPVGTLAEEPDVVTSAVDAWEDMADDKPIGNVYLVAGEQWDDFDVVVLQGSTDSGAASLALLTASGGAEDPWQLKETAELPSDADVEAVVLPGGTIPADAVPRGAGPHSPASLVLGPEWRVSSLGQYPPSVGSQLVRVGEDVGQKPTWEELDRVAGYGWWAPLAMSAPDLTPTTVVLDHTGHGYADTAPVLKLDGSSRLSLLTPSEVSFKLLPREHASSEWLGTIAAVVELLDLAGPYQVTVLSTATGAFGTRGRRSKLDTKTLFAQFTAPELTRPVLVAYATTGDRVSCFSQRPITAADVTLLPLVGLGCAGPVAGGRKYGVQGNELWAFPFLADPQWKSEVLDISVTMVRHDGQSTTHSLGTSGTHLAAVEDGSEPVRRYVFVATGKGGAELQRWVWPASNIEPLPEG